MLLTQPIPVRAQQQADSAYPLRWWHGLAAAGAVAGTMLIDQSSQHFFQTHRSSGGDDIASAFRHMGQPEVYATVGLGTLAAGLIAHDDEVARAGGRISVSLLLAGALTGGGKIVVGRVRPETTTDAFQFHPFSSNESFPSGHSTMAFALATSVSDELHSPVATVLLYTAATGTAWSRLNDNRHWVSDVVAGAMVGIVSAKLVDGRWRIFHLHPPHILLGPSGARLDWTLH